MFLARRGLLRLIGTAPAAMPFAKASLTAAISRAEPLMALAGVAGGMMGIPADAPQTQPSDGPPGRKLLGPILYSELNSLRQQNEAEKGARYNLREAGIESDIAALKSTSRAYKVMRQIQRDREEASISARIEKLMWG